MNVCFPQLHDQYVLVADVVDLSLTQMPPLVAQTKSVFVSKVTVCTKREHC